MYAQNKSKMPAVVVVVVVKTNRLWWLFIF